MAVVKDRLPALQHAGTLLGTSVSAGFLLLIAGINLAALLDIFAAPARARRRRELEDVPDRPTLRARLRHRHRNALITLISVFIALAVGGIEAIGVVADRFRLNGVSAAAYKLLGYDEMEREPNA